MGNAQSNSQFQNIRENQKRSKDTVINGTRNNGATTVTTTATVTAITGPKSTPIVSNSKSTSIYGSSPFVGSPLYFSDQYGKRINRSNSNSRDDLSSPRSLNSSHLKESFEASLSNSKDNPLHNSGGQIHSNKKTKRTVPTIITWNKGGQNVYLTGTFNNWSVKIPLNKSQTDFSTVVNLPVGTHRFKFIVDDVWKCSDDLPTASDVDGNLINYVEVTDDDKQINVFNENCDSFGYSESPTEEYTNEIPNYLTSIIPNYYSDNINTDYEYNEDEQPPLLPPHLERVLLNVSHKNEDPSKEDPMILPVPNHVVLNHLYTLSIRDGVMALGTTTRYRKKYVTTLYYKPVELPQ